MTKDIIEGVSSQEEEFRDHREKRTQERENENEVEKAVG